MATDRKAPGASGAHIPDLDVRTSKAAPKPVPQKAQPKVSSPPSSPSRGGGVQDYFGSGTFDADHFGDAGSADLQTDESAAGIFASPSFSDELPFHGEAAALDLDGGVAPGSVPSRGGPTAPSHRWPTGRSPDAASIDVDAVEIRLAADYGAPPSSPFAAPVYAVRVLQRRRNLKAKVKLLAVSMSEAETRRDELLVSAIQDLRGKLALTEGGEQMLSPVLDIERQALDRRSALAGTNEEYDRRIGEVREGEAALEREATQKDSEVEQAAVALGREQVFFDRANAKKKRLYIEIRGILDVAERTGGKLSPAQSARVAELEAAVAANGPELARTEAAEKSAEAVHAARQNERRQISRRIAEAGRQRRAIDDEFKKQIGARSEGVSESEHQRSEALAEVMRNVLASRGRALEVPGETLDAIAKADELVVKRAVELEKFVRAIDSYDRAAYQRGLVIGVIAIGLLFAVIVVSTVV